MGVDAASAVTAGSLGLPRAPRGLGDVSQWTASDFKKKDPEFYAKLMGLTDMDGARALMQEVMKEEAALEESLESLLGKKPALLEEAERAIQAGMDILETVEVDAEGLVEMMKEAREVAERVSRDVRRLDAAKASVKGTLDYVTQFLDRRAAVEGARDAIGEGDVERACVHIDSWYTLGEKMAKEEGSEGVHVGGGGGGEGDSGPGVRPLLEARAKALEEDTELARLTKDRFPEGISLGQVPEEIGDEAGEREAEERMREYVTAVGGIVRKRFEDSVGRGEHAGVLGALRMFPQLRLHGEGLEAFVGYLTKLVGSRADEDLEGLSEGLAADGSSGDRFVEALGNLFADLGEALSRNANLVRDLFGPEGVIRVVQALHLECDARGVKLLAKYREYTRLEARAAEVTGERSRRMRLTGEAGGEGVERTAMAVDRVLDEIVVLHQRCEEYTRFMLGCLAGETPGGVAAPETVAQFRSGSAFSRAVQELIGYYITLEEFYMMENVGKAVRLDNSATLTGGGEDVMAGGSLVSSMVDDAFYVMQKSLQRALATGSVHCVCAVVNHVNGVLSGEFREAVEALLARSWGSAVQEAFTGVDAGSRAWKVQDSVALNNASISAANVGKLRRELEGGAEYLFSGQELEKCRGVSSDMGEASKAFTKISESGVVRLVKSFQETWQPVIDGLAASSYELWEDGEFQEDGSGWVLGLCSVVQSLMAPLEGTLAGDAYDEVLLELLVAVNRAVEKVVMQKQFTVLGGLQLDKDVRQLQNYVGRLTERSVRDKFARLLQVATVVSLEQVTEIMQYWGDKGGMTWRLSASEVRRVLSLRLDFKPDAIAQLNL